MFLKFWTSNISIFFWKKKTIVLKNFLIKSRIHTVQQHKHFEIFLETMER